MLRTILTAVCLMGLMVACRDHKQNKPADREGQAEASRDEALLSEGEAGRTAEIVSSPQTIAAGTTAVFGLVLPRRMTPAKSAANVYRYTGNYPVVHLVSFFREQLSRSQLTREGEGYLIRFGQVRRPVGQSTGEELLAIRVGRGMKGAVADIWQERDYKKSLPESYRRGGSRRALLKSRKTVEVNRNVAEVRKKEKQETLRVMKKIAAGKKLDAKDYESPFFD